MARDHGCGCRGHQFAVQRDIEDLLAVPPPTRLRPSIGGHQEGAARTGEGLHINLKALGHIRLVLDPAAVWRKLAFSILEGSIDNGKRLALFHDRQRPQVHARLDVESTT